jgi:hypothetical protein
VKRANWVEKMTQRKPKNAVSVGEQADSAAGLSAALTKRRKAELVKALLELAQEDRRILRWLTARFDVGATPEALVAETRQAIADATDFDERDINRNFDYDYEAYRAVQRNLSRLIDVRQLPHAMQLSLELMKAGSHQVEMSDEGLMSDDIEDCLRVVIHAVTKCDLPANEVIAWCSAMLDSDRVGCLAAEQLESLRQQRQKTAAR